MKNFSPFNDLSLIGIWLLAGGSGSCGGLLMDLGEVEVLQRLRRIECFYCILLEGPGLQVLLVLFLLPGDHKDLPQRPN
ncbi:MAG: hypothetical protein CMO40_08615 [Verrucomicrobiaceae bacterium]|nr:hypothetical protein [Verrucomicrobiaceae bacterium]